MSKKILKSRKLDNVCYEIRGPVAREAKKLEDEGYKVQKLNIGNPAPFGFDAPEEIIQDIIYNLPKAQGYSDSKGIFSARKAVMHYCQEINIPNVSIEDIYMGNGVSELIVMATQGLINDGDEVLLPSPDYPLWTAAVRLSNGKAVHYVCDEQSEWQPDIKDIKKKITPKTKAIVIITPNNPTGAVYSSETLEQIAALAKENNLIIFSDEIYDKILFDGAVHTPIGSLTDDVPVITFNGLSKTYRAAGFRSGWMVVSGPKSNISNYIEGLDMLSSMRLCANVPAQYAVQTALGGVQSIKKFLLPEGRLTKQKNLAYKMLTDIPGVSCVAPKGALYLFPKLDPEVHNIIDDEKMVLDLLIQEKVLIVQGSAFNLNDQNHFRVVFLPSITDLTDIIGKMKHFFSKYRQ